MFDTIPFQDELVFLKVVQVVSSYEKTFLLGKLPWTIRTPFVYTLLCFAIETFLRSIWHEMMEVQGHEDISS
jgi:hypothetical protein